MTADDDWADYSSAQMFPGCDCGHDAIEHEAAWSEWRPQFKTTDGCGIDGCPCEITWEHT